METISPQTSPTSSISPPVTPFNIALPHTYALPPIKTLPTWNRNKFRESKLARSIPKNRNIKVELIGQIGQVENSTQTSPDNFIQPAIPQCSSSEMLTSAKAQSSRRSSDDDCNRLKKTYDKKMVFLETIHKEVLSNLHQELEKVKSENRALKFQLVMAGDRVPPVCPEDDVIDNVEEKIKGVNMTGKGSGIDQEFSCEERKLLKGQVKELKKLLHEADSKNIHLTNLIELLKQRSTSSRVLSGTNNRSKCVTHNKSDFSLLPSANNVQQQRQSSSAKLLTKTLNCNFSNKNSDDDDKYKEALHRFKELKTLPQDEVVQQEGKKQDPDCENNSVMFPKIDPPSSRSAPVPSHSSAARIYKRIQEPLSLPVLNGLPSNRNMTLRQKRAQALHVRRQRSNKAVTVTTAAAAATANQS